MLKIIKEKFEDLLIKMEENEILSYLFGLLGYSLLGVVELLTGYSYIFGLITLEYLGPFVGSFLFTLPRVFVLLVSIFMYYKIPDHTVLLSDFNSLFEVGFSISFLFVLFTTVDFFYAKIDKTMNDIQTVLDEAEEKPEIARYPIFFVTRNLWEPLKSASISSSIFHGLVVLGILLLAGFNSGINVPTFIFIPMLYFVLLSPFEILGKNLALLLYTRYFHFKVFLEIEEMKDKRQEEQRLKRGTELPLKSKIDSFKKGFLLKTRNLIDTALDEL